MQFKVNEYNLNACTRISEIRANEYKRYKCEQIQVIKKLTNTSGTNLKKYNYMERDKCRNTKYNVYAHINITNTIT